MLVIIRDHVRVVGADCVFLIDERAAVLHGAAVDLGAILEEAVRPDLDASPPVSLRVVVERRLIDVANESSRLGIGEQVVALVVIRAIIRFELVRERKPLVLLPQGAVDCKMVHASCLDVNYSYVTRDVDVKGRVAGDVARTDADFQKRAFISFGAHPTEATVDRGGEVLALAFEVGMVPVGRGDRADNHLGELDYLIEPMSGSCQVAIAVAVAVNMNILYDLLFRGIEGGSREVGRLEACLLGAATCLTLAKAPSVASYDSKCIQDRIKLEKLFLRATPGTIGCTASATTATPSAHAFCLRSNDLERRGHVHFPKRSVLNPR
mmetsp:Transcript_33853/g.54497  ORF Transcript_33853/g.54497 Transcript_33853/m.54497 type:complete len:323 (-) Transcript_33853:109-1077(-)